MRNKLKIDLNNYTRGKIDCAGLDVPKLLEEVKNEV